MADPVTISPQAFLKMSPEERVLTIQNEFQEGCLREPRFESSGLLGPEEQKLLQGCFVKANPVAVFLKPLPPPVQAGILIGLTPKLSGNIFLLLISKLLHSKEKTPEEVAAILLQIPPFEMFQAAALIAQIPTTKREEVLGLLEKEKNDNAWRLLDAWEISFLVNPEIRKKTDWAEVLDATQKRASLKEVFGVVRGKMTEGELAKKHGAPRPKPSGGEFSLPSRWSDYADLKIRFYLDPKRWSLSGRFLDRLSDRWLPFRYLAGADQIRIDGKAYAPTKPQRAIVEGKLFPHVRSQSPRR